MSKICFDILNIDIFNNFTRKYINKMGQKIGVYFCFSAIFIHKMLLKISGSYKFSKSRPNLLLFFLSRIRFIVSNIQFSKDRHSSSQQTCLIVIHSNKLSVFVTILGISFLL